MFDVLTFVGGISGARVDDSNISRDETRMIVDS